ncbi:MAG: hypothetical protein ACFFCZ_31475 [Promethearchaeota archaeon]
MNKNRKVMITAAGLTVLCLSVTLSPFLEVNAFDYFFDLDWNDHLSGIEHDACSIINDCIEQTNGINDFIFFNAYASATLSRLFFRMLGI